MIMLGDKFQFVFRKGQMKFFGKYFFKKIYLQCLYLVSIFICDINVFLGKEKYRKLVDDDGGFSGRGFFTCLGLNFDVFVQKDQFVFNTLVFKRIFVFIYCFSLEFFSRLLQFFDSRSFNVYLFYSVSFVVKFQRFRDYDFDTGYRSEIEFIRQRRQYLFNE